MNYAEHIAADQRLVILRLLVEANSYKANSAVLTMRMDHLGHAVSRDVVRSHLAWLAEQGLVSIDEPVPQLLVATLSARGDDVVRGRAVVPGVSRPGA